MPCCFYLVQPIILCLDSEMLSSSLHDIKGIGSRTWGKWWWTQCLWHACKYINISLPTHQWTSRLHGRWHLKVRVATLMDRSAACPVMPQITSQKHRQLSGFPTSMFPSKGLTGAELNWLLSQMLHKRGCRSPQALPLLQRWCWWLCAPISFFRRGVSTNSHSCATRGVQPILFWLQLLMVTQERLNQVEGISGGCALQSKIWLQCLQLNRK